MLIQRGLVGVQNVYRVVKLGGEGFEMTRLQLAAARRYFLKTAGGVLELDAVQKIQVLSDMETCLRPHPQRPPSCIWDA